MEWADGSSGRELGLGEITKRIQDGEEPIDEKHLMSSGCERAYVQYSEARLSSGEVVCVVPQERSQAHRTSILVTS